MGKVSRTRFAHLMRWCVVLCVCAVGVVFAGAARAESLVTVPALDGGVFSDTPRLLTVPSGVDVTLEDQWGTPIPFTGALRDGSAFLLPSVPPGEYAVVASDGSSASFTVKTETFSEEFDAYPLPDPDRAPLTPGSVPWLTVLVVVAAGGVVVVLVARTRRWLPVLAVVSLTAVAAAVVVVPPAASAGEVPSYEECLTLASGDVTATVFSDCSFDRLVWTFEQEGLAPALSEMEAAALPVCHELVHQFGVFAWLRLDDPSQVLLPGLGTCNAAYYHGALYGASTYSDDEEFVRSVAQVCVDTAEPNDPNGACYHGVGHALALRFGGDTVRARNMCDALIPDPGVAWSECVGAVYMQHAIRFAGSKGVQEFMPTPEVPVDVACAGESDAMVLEFCFTAFAMAAPRVPGVMDDLIALCNEQSGEVQVLCASGVAGEFRSIAPGGGVEPAVACSGLSSTAAVRECVREYAYFAFDQFRDVSLLDPICEAAAVPVLVCRSAHPAAYPDGDLTGA